MCKIAVLTNMTKIQKTQKVIDTIARHISLWERDGFGYAIQSEKGLFGERTLNTATFKSVFTRPLLKLPFVSEKYNRFGEFGAPSGAGIFHGRTSTNDVNLTNTHPINKHDWSLIHNGVVTNYGPKYEMQTTNDSEDLVHYMANGGIKELAKHLGGYYAAAAFDPKGDLHIFRDDRATLFWCEIAELDTYLIATTEALIEAICKDMKWKPSIISEMSVNTYLVLRKNDIIELETFEPRGATAFENQWSRKSLGYAYEDYEDYKYDKWRDGSISESHYPKSLSAKDIDSTVAGVLEGSSTVMVGGRDFTLDEANFLIEMEQQADHTYRIYDYRDNLIDIDMFLSLDDEDKFLCTCVRPDGTIVDPEDYDSDVLYSGGGAA